MEGKEGEEVGGEGCHLRGVFGWGGGQVQAGERADLVRADGINDLVLCRQDFALQEDPILNLEPLLDQHVLDRAVVNGFRIKEDHTHHPRRSATLGATLPLEEGGGDGVAFPTVLGEL